MFKIRPKILKFYSNKKKTITISIDRVKINIDKIFKILELFKIKNFIVITDLEKNNILFDEFENRQISYTTSISKEKNKYVEVILMVSDKEKNILTDIVKTNPEEIFVYSVKDTITWEQYLYNNRRIQWKNNEMSDLLMGFIFKEDEINISYNVEVYDFEIINTEIKKITFD